MWAILIQAWRDLPARGKTVVAVTILLALAGLIGLAMWLRYDLSWLPEVVGMGALVPPPRSSLTVGDMRTVQCPYCGTRQVATTAANCINCGASSSVDRLYVDMPKPKPPVRPAPNNPTELR